MPLSGHKTVAVAGAAEKLGAQLVNGPLMVKALSGNTGAIYIGNDAEDVSSADGLELLNGEALIFDFIGNLANVWIDAAVSGEGVAWIKLCN